MKQKIVIFGAGGGGRYLYSQLRENAFLEIVAFIDTFKTGALYGIPIYSPEKLHSLEFDLIYIATIAYSEVLEQLRLIGINENKIVKSTVADKATARVIFLKNLAKEIYRKDVPGSVAEAGVFRGEFAKMINQFFPDKKLYLFDTFSGFDNRDIQIEEGYEQDPLRGEYFKKTSVDLVLSKMRYPENCIVKRGYVPETLQGIEDQFCFINLDMDLYQPTLVALEWFWPRMVQGSVILIHDYFDETGTFPNLKKAVIKFVEEHQVRSMPIGDDLSIALVK